MIKLGEFLALLRNTPRWYSPTSVSSRLSRGFNFVFSAFIRRSIIHFLTVSSLLTDIFSCFALASDDGSIAPYAKLSRLPHEYRLHEYEKSFAPRVCYLIAKNAILLLLGMCKKMYMRFYLIEVNGPKIEVVNFNRHIIAPIASEVGLHKIVLTLCRSIWLRFWGLSNFGDTLFSRVCPFLGILPFIWGRSVNLSAVTAYMVRPWDVYGR